MKQNSLYIIHGWTYKPEPWLEVVSVLKSKHHIAAELLRVPGLGTQSTKVYTIDDYVTWAKRQIPQGAIALGHSNGGRILLNLATKYPTHLGAMILLDSAGIYEKSFKRDFSRVLSKLFAPLKHLPFCRRVVHRLLGANDYANAPDNMKKTLTNMLDSDRRLDVSLVRTPTAIIWGADDQITPLRQGKKLHAGIQGSSLSVREGWRHSHYLVSAEELADEIARNYHQIGGSPNVAR